MNALHHANKYFNDAEPWAKVKNPKRSYEPTREDRLRVNNVLYLSLESLRIAAILLQPVIPQSCDAILNSLSIPMPHRTMEYAKVGYNYSQNGGGPVSDTPLILFKRIDTKDLN